MTDQDEVGRRIARLLDQSAEGLSAEERTRLIEARRLALARHRGEQEHALEPAWAGAMRGFTEQRVMGIRYVLPMAALVLGLLGVVYMHTGGVPSEIADIDAALLSDELPISAYLDQGFDAWLKRSSR